MERKYSDGLVTITVFVLLRYLHIQIIIFNLDGIFVQFFAVVHSIGLHFLIGIGSNENVSVSLSLYAFIC